MAWSFTHSGWIDAPHIVEEQMKLLPMPFMKGNAPFLDEKKTVLLYDAVRQVSGGEIISGPQGIGDCVSWGWTGADEIIQAVQILQQRAEGRQFQAFKRQATEAIYALSRVEIGGQRGSRSDGSTGIWAARAVSTKGTLSRDYLAAKTGKGDYDPSRAKQWGASGLPDDFEPEALQHLIKTVSKVLSFEEAAAAIQNGYPVPVCSNIGYHMDRDGQGFGRRNPRDPWNHCMLFCGVRWDRPGLAMANSWGMQSFTGPIDLNQPRNVIWVEPKDVDLMLRQGDSYAASQHMGYPEQDLVSWEH